jgi:hypothetical protein
MCESTSNDKNMEDLMAMTSYIKQAWPPTLWYASYVDDYANHVK